jgi:hypothetical protein
MGANGSVREAFISLPESSGFGPEAFISLPESPGFWPESVDSNPESSEFRVPSQCFWGQSVDSGFEMNASPSESTGFEKRSQHAEDPNESSGD